MAGSLQRDLFCLENPTTDFPPSNTKKAPILQRGRSFREIQGVISKINPEIIKSVIANEAQKKEPSMFPACDSTLRLSCGYEKKAETAPMTIFYNGMVAVFDMPADKAQHILKAAEKIISKPEEHSQSSTSRVKENLLESLKEDLPITRKNSLQRFLEKRKERLSVISPYYFPT